jgi:hypothetical protein
LAKQGSFKIRPTRNQLLFQLHSPFGRTVRNNSLGEFLLFSQCPKIAHSNSRYDMIRNDMIHDEIVSPSHLDQISSRRRSGTATNGGDSQPKISHFFDSIGVFSALEVPEFLGSGRVELKRNMAMNQYLLIPFLEGWTSIYQLF